MASSPPRLAIKGKFRGETQVSDPPFLVKIAVKEDVGSQKHLKELLKIDPVRGKSRITHFRANSSITRIIRKHVLVFLALG